MSGEDKPDDAVWVVHRCFLSLRYCLTLTMSIAEHTTAKPIKMIVATVSLSMKSAYS